MVTPNRCLKQWEPIVNRHPRNKLQWNCNQNAPFSTENLEKSSANCPASCSCLYSLTHCTAHLLGKRTGHTCRSHRSTTHACWRTRHPGHKETSGESWALWTEIIDSTTCWGTWKYFRRFEAPQQCRKIAWNQLEHTSSRSLFFNSIHSRRFVNWLTGNTEPTDR